MNNFFINTYKKIPIIVKSGSGAWLYSAGGKKYLDFLSGISINNIGYGNSKIINKIFYQAKKVIHPSNYYYTKPQLELAKKLINKIKLDKVFFANSGTEANEAALLFLSKYKERIFSNRNEIIVLDGSFLGRTYGSRSVAAGLGFENLKIKKIPFNDIKSFKKNVSNKTLAVHLELILGHAGIKPANFDFINKISKICKIRDIIIFIDEIQTGLGRAGEMFAFKIYKLDPDIVTLGKSLGGGIPLSATIVKKRIADKIKPGDYGSTMGGNSLACSAGNVIVDYLSKEKNIKRINEKGEYILKNLDLLKFKYASIMDVRGMGLMIGIEFKERAEAIQKSCIKNGLLVDVVNKNTLRILPPFNITKEDIDWAIDKLSLSISENSHDL